MRPDRWLRRWLSIREYRRVLDKVTAALLGGRHAEAESICERALRLAEELYGVSDPEIVTPLYVLGSARLAQGRAEEALVTCRRALTIANEAPAATDPALPRILEQIAAIFERQGRLDKVAEILRKVLDGYDRMREPDPTEVAALANRLALLLGRQGRHGEAGPLFKRALDLRERALGKSHPLVAEVLHNAATYRHSDRSLAEAEGMFRRALEIVTQPGDSSTSLAALHGAILHNLAVTCEEQGRPAEAVGLLEEALAMKERLVGADHHELRPTIVRLARLHAAARRFALAIPLYERALAIAKCESGVDYAVVSAIGAWLAAARAA